MSFFNALFTGLKDVWEHKFRSFLTMLGIILGVASLVGMAAIVKGMENGMKDEAPEPKNQVSVPASSKAK